MRRERRIGLPRATVAAIIATTPCPECDSEPNHVCTSISFKPGARGKLCGPHGARIKAWHDLGMPTGGAR